MPFLVGAGELSDSEMTSGSIALQSFWGIELFKCTSKDSPNEILRSLPEKDALFQLMGDAGKFHSESGSWLECLGAWKKPVILMVAPTSQDQIPGTAAAYVSLCHELSVALVGIVQLGGKWDLKSRSLDGLPWCGCLPIKKLEDESNEQIDAFLHSSEDAFVVVENLKRRMSILNL